MLTKLHRLGVIVLIASALSGCTEQTSMPDVRDAGGVRRGQSSGTKVDLLFMVDNSNSMNEEQEKLRAQIPMLVSGLLEGVDLDGDGELDYRGATDVHLGVVSSDLGIPGVRDVEGCTDPLGDEGILINAPRDPDSSCETDPIEVPFLTYREGVSSADRVAADLACIASVGTDGCGFEMQLESALKALWPKSNDELEFVVDPSSGFGARGQSGPGAPNGNFIRDNPEDLSLIAIVLLTDEDDCSSSDTTHFLPAAYPEGLNTRCYHESKREEPNGLFDIERYVDSFKKLRPGNEDLVVFGAIAGVPPELVSEDVIGELDYDSEDSVDTIYGDLLADPQMRYALDDRDTPDEPADDLFVASCTDAEGAPVAFPPRRIVEVARGFGTNGFVHSICEDDFSAATGLLIRRIAAALAPYQSDQ